MRNSTIEDQNEHIRNLILVSQNKMEFYISVILWNDQLGKLLVKTIVLSNVIWLVKNRLFIPLTKHPPNMEGVL